MRALAFIPLLVLLFVATGSAIGAVTTSEAARSCGADALGNQVRAEFPLAKSRDFGTHFPSAGGGPELNVDSPAVVVVFQNPYVFFRDGKEYQDVVCVVIDGVPNLYPQVPLADAKMR